MGEVTRKVLRAFAVGAIVSVTTGPGEAASAGEETTTAPPPREPSSLTPSLRARGYNACFMPDPGFGAYGRWQRVGMGYMIVPLHGGHTQDGGYDVVVHFHGR